MRPNFPVAVDPPFPAGGNAAHQLQRAGLALDGNEIVVGYGGNDGDCGTYWGWLVAAPTSGVGPTYNFQVEATSGHHGGAIWGSGNAPAIDSGGDVYAATGNGYSGGTFDYSESVLRLEPDLAARRILGAPRMARTRRTRRRPRLQQPDDPPQRPRLRDREVGPRGAAAAGRVRGRGRVTRPLRSRSAAPGAEGSTSPPPPRPGPST